MTIKKRQRAARKSGADCSVWIIRDMRANRIEIASGMAFPTEAIAQSYCRLPGDKPFKLYLIRKARRPALTPNAEAHGRQSRTVQPLVGSSDSQPKGE